VFIGVDGGGTQARAVVVSEQGIELARETGPAGIVDSRDPAAAADVIAQLVRVALSAAGATPPAPVLCCGLAGAGRGTEREAVRVALTLNGVAERVVVIGDADIAMYNAFGHGPGVLLIGGTGSIAWAQNAGRPAVRVGGWGALLGDEGSGYAIGLDALRAVVWAHDGRALPTRLTNSLLAATGAEQADALIAFVEAAAKHDIAALAPLVLQCAAAGDTAAVHIRDHAVSELVALVVSASQRAALPAPVVALAGGLLAPGGALRDQAGAAIVTALPAASLLSHTIDAARGAADLARAASGPASS
jgi:N-acetylglucosamine kinase-like BadF-type ATPase